MDEVTCDLLQHIYGHMLHASGKFVPAIISQLGLSEKLGEREMEVLSRHQGLVMVKSRMEGQVRVKEF